MSGSSYYIHLYFDEGMIELRSTGDYAIGAMWLYRIGNWSRYRIRFLQIGRLTLYLHLGRREPHNPSTGESFGPGSV